MQPTLITNLSLPSRLFLLLLPLSFASSALSKLFIFFLITGDLNRLFGATSASFRIEDRASTQSLCSQAIHTQYHRRSRTRHARPGDQLQFCNFIEDAHGRLVLGPQSTPRVKAPSLRNSSLHSISTHLEYVGANIMSALIKPIPPAVCVAYKCV